jgi:hypothetical protein
MPDLDEARRQGVPVPPFDEEAMKAGWFGNEGGWFGVWSFEPGTDVLWSYFEGIDLAPRRSGPAGRKNRTCRIRLPKVPRSCG